MEVTNESLFQLMRFNILNSAYLDLQKSPFSSGYIYAWESSVFPIFNEGADWHKPFLKEFYVCESEVSELSQFLDEKWLAKTSVSFYELEEHYGVRGSSHSSSNWERGKLLKACRYMFLDGRFDDTLWSSLIENGNCPIEAHSICKPLKETDIYFM